MSTDIESKRQEVKLGNLVIDAATGFAGTAVMFQTFLGGTKHILIQPSCDPNSPVVTLPKDESFDFHMVDVLGPGVADRVYPQDTDVKVELGKRYKDVVSGFIGIAVCKFESLQGCVQFTLTSHRDGHHDVPAQNAVVDHKRLEYVDDGVVNEVEHSDSGCIRHPDAIGHRI